ncbi:hypothetical protein RF11_11812 [Thelohanellus kitauei]|uniref:Uncharacterized protein n=1 Tax=Thelohanellus kitauei TaxID=669202 RepID=A0A0C2JVN0_THEKT|nr:hypothetical protein RF11_11812 [Thelohanellus kitauei]
MSALYYPKFAQKGTINGILHLKYVDNVGFAIDVKCWQKRTDLSTSNDLCKKRLKLIQETISTSNSLLYVVVFVGAQFVSFTIYFIKHPKILSCKSNIWCKKNQH